ncbi:unnamed protein product, partial [Discosporangium mesarthrocarpum]
MVVDGRGVVEVLSSTFLNNSATEAGGLLLDGNFTANITGSLFQGNKAVEKGGAFVVDVSAWDYHTDFLDNVSGGSGGALSVSGDGASLILLGGLFQGNEASRRLFGNTNSFTGGALDADWGGNATLSGVRFSENTADDGGGAVSVAHGAHLASLDCSFNLNRAGWEGGAITWGANTSGSVTGGVLEENTVRWG